jgi:protein-S-isoprenylcysteine O-methyltransferase Ste14
MMIAVGNFLFRYRNALFPLVCLLLLFLPGPRLFAHSLTAAAAGAAVALAGQAVRVFTIGLRYIVRGGRHGRVYAADLVTEGVYGLCRNPMYVGNFLLVTGLAIAFNSLTALLCGMLLAAFAYAAIVAAEEHFLRGKFGAAYEAYCRDVPRWLPRLGAARGLLAGSTFHWRRVIVKEYGTPFAWISAIALTIVFRLWREGGLENHQNVVRGLLALIGLAAGLWIIARVLKKTRRLIAV